MKWTVFKSFRNKMLMEVFTLKSVDTEEQNILIDIFHMIALANYHRWYSKELDKWK